MKSTSLLLLAAGLLAFAGCSTPTSVDSGTIRARTFNFVSKHTGPAPRFADNRGEVHEVIQKAIAKNLEAKGLKQVSANGDIAVPYLVVLSNNVSTTAISDYFGYSKDLAALHEKAHSVAIDHKNPNAFEAGTLLIDIVDGNSFKLLERSYVTRPMLRDLSDKDRAVRIQNVVDEILKNAKFAP